MKSTYHALLWIGFAVAGTALAACGARSQLGLGGTQTGSGGAGTSSGSGGTSSATAGGTASTVVASSSGSSGASTGTGGAPSSDGGPFSGDVLVSQSGYYPYHEYNTQVAVAPDGTIAVVWVAWGQTEASVIKYTFSTDGGYTFSTPTFVMGTGDTDYPTVAVDAAGNFYLAFLSYQLAPDSTRIDGAVYVTRAVAGSTSFAGMPVQVSEPTTQGENTVYDTPWITIAPDGAPIVTFQRDGLNGVGIQAARSDDQGATWTTRAVAVDPTMAVVRSWNHPCWSEATGRLYVTYLASQASGTHVGIGWSDDGGVTWVDPAATPVVDPGPNAVAIARPECAAVGSTVHVIYGHSPDPLANNMLQLLTDVEIATSTDGGATFSKQVTSVAGTGSKLRANPQLIADPAGGFDVVYYTGNADKDSGGAYVWGRALATDPLAFQLGTVRKPIVFIESRDAVNRIGDYTGLLVHGGTLYTSYVDNVSGQGKIRVHIGPL